MALRKRRSRTTRRKVVPVLSAVLVSLGVVFLAELPRNAAGKVVKPVLRETAG